MPTVLAPPLRYDLAGEYKLGVRALVAPKLACRKR